jgi:thiaminase/transcriptional activator TenA
LTDTVQAKRNLTSISLKQQVVSRFTNELRAAAGDHWTALSTDRFTSELSSGTMNEMVMRRYLIQDFRFLDSFIILLVFIIAHARSLSDRIPGCQFLAAITGAENTYFQNVLTPYLVAP